MERTHTKSNSLYGTRSWSIKLSERCSGVGIWNLIVVHKLTPFIKVDSLHASVLCTDVMSVKKITTVSASSTPFKTRQFEKRLRATRGRT